MLTKPLERKTITNKSRSNTKKYEMAAETSCKGGYKREVLVQWNFLIISVYYNTTICTIWILQY